MRCWSNESRGVLPLAVSSSSVAPFLDLSVSNPSHYSGVRVRELRTWLVEVLSSVAPETDGLGVRFTSDLGIRELNREYRHRDKATDVLSFPGESTPEGDYLGDICISIPTARRQAMAAGHGLDFELRVLLLHGVLHCLGYDHETDGGEMERLEKRLRKRWIGVPTAATQEGAA
ncbi:MAG: rRNA maturation RNase YbeY [Thermoanaerobaculia bacterium]|nr:rRNA maturation RNase YbeY [Thermoanaerobaculia bacterium]